MGTGGPFGGAHPNNLYSLKGRKLPPPAYGLSVRRRWRATGSSGDGHGASRPSIGGTPPWWRGLKRLARPWPRSPIGCAISCVVHGKAARRPIGSTRPPTSWSMPCSNWTVFVGEIAIRDDDARCHLRNVWHARATPAWQFLIWWNDS